MERMNNDAISRSAALKIMEDDLLLHEGEVKIVEKICTRVRELSALDVAPSVHARWIDEIEPNSVTASGREVHYFRCSACDFEWNNKSAVLHYFKHCPNCGARMDREE